MRCPSTFSETRLRSSFFLTTPAKKPRTECCCQPVAFMIAAIVVPFGSYSIFSTADCLDDEHAGDFADTAFVAAALVAAVGFDRAGTLLLAGRFTLRDDLRAVVADFDFDLLVAIWLSTGSTTASGAGTGTAPPIGGRGERRVETVAIRETGGSATRRRLAGDRLRKSVVRYPSRPTRLRRRCPPARRLRRPWRYARLRSAWNESQSARSAGSIVAWSMVASRYVPPRTLRTARKSSKS